MKTCDTNDLRAHRARALDWLRFVVRPWLVRFVMELDDLAFLHSLSVCQPLYRCL